MRFRILLLVPSLACSACFPFWLQDTFYGVQKIETPSGEILYLRRVARGLNYDVLYLTKTKDICQEPERQETIKFPVGRRSILYKFERSNLVIYDVAKIDIPPGTTFKTRILFHELENLAYMELSERRD